MCMRTIEKRTVLEEPILAWKVLKKRNNEYVTPITGFEVRAGVWVPAEPQLVWSRYSRDVRRSKARIGSLDTPWGFHTYETEEDATRHARAGYYLSEQLAVPVAIVGRAAYGKQDSSGCYGWTAEWIYYLKTGVLA